MVHYYRSDAESADPSLIGSDLLNLVPNTGNIHTGLDALAFAPLFTWAWQDKALTTSGGAPGSRARSPQDFTVIIWRSRSSRIKKQRSSKSTIFDELRQSYSSSLCSSNQDSRRRFKRFIMASRQLVSRVLECSFYTPKPWPGEGCR